MVGVGRPRPGRWCRPGSPSAEALLQVLIDAPGHIRWTTLHRADEPESAGLGSRYRAIRRRCARRSDDVESLTRAHTMPAELLGQIGRAFRDHQVPTVGRTHDHDCTVGWSARPNARARRTRPQHRHSRDAPRIRSGPAARRSLNISRHSPTPLATGTEAVGGWSAAGVSRVQHHLPLSVQASGARSALLGVRRSSASWPGASLSGSCRRSEHRSCERQGPDPGLLGDLPRLPPTCPTLSPCRYPTVSVQTAAISAGYLCHRSPHPMFCATTN